MADLGALATLYPGLLPEVYYSLPIPNYAAVPMVTGILQLPLRRDGALGGNAKTVGINEPHVDVFVIWRPNCAFIGHARTDLNGDWEIGGFDPTRMKDYAVIYKDPATGTVYNDAIYALVAPAA